MLCRALSGAACALLLVCAAVRTPSAESNVTWLDRVNFYRASALLPPVAEDPRLSESVFQHARYMVMHDVIAHSQKPRQPWATAEGAAAAAVSNLAGSTRATEPDFWAVDTWMQAPFHAVAILDPALTNVGFGIHRAENGGIQTAAGLDVVRGRSMRRAAASYPIVWPANGTVVPLTTHIHEYPNPLTSCRGYSVPAGLPLIVQLGTGERRPNVTGTWVMEGEQLLEHCVFDERSYMNDDAAQQALGRAVLDTRDAVVIIPRRPLRYGSTYRVIVEEGGRRIDWTFGVR